jgi:hypothetical protein
MAKAWLARGGINRKPSMRLVARIAAAIRRGEWKLTGDSIKLDVEQRVIDGQHRLLAIIEAGVPVTVLVVRNVPNEAQDVIDTGRTRVASDVLSMHGFGSTVGMAAAAKLLMIIERFGHPAVSSREVNLLISNASVLRYVQEHADDLKEAVRVADNLRATGHLGGGTGLLAAFATMIRRADAEAAEWFLAALLSGANLDTDSPILRLRTRLLSERQGHRIGTSPPEREALLAICIKAWNAWRRNESMKMLVWRESQGFPVPE